MYRNSTKRLIMLIFKSRQNDWLTSIDVEGDGLQVDKRKSDCSLDERTVLT